MVATVGPNASAAQENEELFGEDQKVTYVFDNIIAALRFVMSAA